jgi:hypothetical protein
VGVFVATVVLGVASGVLPETADDAIRSVGPTPSAGTASLPRTSSTPPATRSTAKRTTRAEQVPPKAAKARSPAAKTTPADGDNWEVVPLEVPENPAPVNEAVIMNSTTSTRRIRVCRQWGDTSCRRSSRRGYLAPGESSAVKLRWADTDGYHDGHAWVKLSGCFGCVVVITVR